MTFAINHAFVSGVADGADATQIQPSHWNAALSVTGALPVANGGTGATDAAGARTALGTAATSHTHAVADLSDASANAKSFLQAANYAAQTALLPAVVGDSGSGGTKGLVPAPASGDAAAGKFLKADGTWTAPSGGGGSPAGSGTEVQYRDGSSFGALSGSSVSGSTLTVTGLGATTITATGTVGGFDIVAGAGGGSLTVSSKFQIFGPTADVIQLMGWGAAINRVQWGGTTSSFPAWKRSGATFQARLADDSGYTDVSVRNVIQNPQSSVTPASNGELVVEATSNTTLTFKLKGSDGTVRTAALTLA